MIDPFFNLLIAVPVSVAAGWFARAATKYPSAQVVDVLELPAPAATQTVSFGTAAPLTVQHVGGQPIHRIIADDGTVHFDSTDGVAAVEKLEELEYGHRLHSSITFTTNGVPRKRVEAQ